MPRLSTAPTTPYARGHLVRGLLVGLPVGDVVAVEAVPEVARAGAQPLGAAEVVGAGEGLLRRLAAGHAEGERPGHDEQAHGGLPSRNPAPGRRRGRHPAGGVNHQHSPLPG